MPESLREIDEFFLKKDEPLRSYLLFLRNFIINYHPDVTEAWKYKMPFYCFKGKMFCYLWVQKGTNRPYIGVVEGRKIDHPLLIQEKRSRMKILLLDVDQDVPVGLIRSILETAIGFIK